MATEYFVNPAGNDNNAGTNQLPFKTLAKAVSMLKPGDVMNVSGNFTTGLVASKSGESGNLISIVGNNATITTNDRNGITISGNYVRVSGFKVSGGVSFGIFASSKNLEIVNNEIFHNVTENNGGGTTCTGSGSWGSGLKVGVGGENILIKGNKVYENCGEGIAVTRGIKVMVENNIVRDNFSVNIYLDNSPYSEALNNDVSCTGIYLRSGNRMTGIAVAEEDYSGWGAQRHDNKVIGNIVNGCYRGITSWAPEVSTGKFIRGEISNNTVLGGQNGSIVIDSVNENVLVSNNKIYTEMRIKNMSGVTLDNNVVGGVVGPTRSFTTVPTPTRINTPTTAKTSTPTKTPTMVPSPTKAVRNCVEQRKIADANCDGEVDILDYSVWYKQFYDGGKGDVVKSNWEADFTGISGTPDGKVDVYDYSMWLAITIDN